MVWTWYRKIAGQAQSLQMATCPRALTTTRQGEEDHVIHTWWLQPLLPKQLTKLHNRARGPEGWKLLFILQRDKPLHYGITTDLVCKYRKTTSKRRKLWDSQRPWGARDKVCNMLSLSLCYFANQLLRDNPQAAAEGQKSTELMRSRLLKNHSKVGMVSSQRLGINRMDWARCQPRWTIGRAILDEALW